VKRPIIAAVLVASLSGCALETVVIGLSVATTAYCAGISNAGKEAIRDTVTAGKKIIACEEAE